ncbi:MAG: hypothetical protein AB2689_08600 [Candidatus Thiodiazotropha taylori]
MNKKPINLFIIGHCCSGKSTILKELGNATPFEIIDMDDNPPPTIGREHWRQYRVEEIMHYAYSRNIELDKRPIIIGGWFWPSEIIASPYFSSCFNTKVFLLHTDHDCFIKRMNNRENNLDHSNIFSEFPSLCSRLIDQTNSIRNSTILNTTHKSIDQVTRQIKKSLAE